MRRVLAGALVLTAIMAFGELAQAGHGGSHQSSGQGRPSAHGRHQGWQQHAGRNYRGRYNFTSRYWNSRYGCYCYWDAGCQNYFYWCGPRACYYPISYIQTAPPVVAQEPVVQTPAPQVAPLVTPPVVATVTTPVVIQAGAPIVATGVGGPNGPAGR